MTERDALWRVQDIMESLYGSGRQEPDTRFRDHTRALPVEPHTPDPEELAAARRMIDKISEWAKSEGRRGLTQDERALILEALGLVHPPPDPDTPPRPVEDRPRGRCPVCHHTHRLRKDGRIAAHPSRQTPEYWCDGVGEAPLPLTAPRKPTQRKDSAA
jgi:hypothetical protein